MKSLFLSAVTSFLSVFSADAQSPEVQWRVEDGGNGHWYAAVRAGAGIRWPDARAASEAIGGHLATITSADEDAFVGQLVSDSVYWIGASRVPGGPCSSDVGWYWVSGEAFAYSRWAATQPNCWAEGQLFLAVNNITYLPGWHDYDDGVMSWYVVEWSSDCNNDGIVDYGQCRDGSLPDYDGDNVPDCCEAGTPCVVGRYPFQWRVSAGGNGHWYQAVRAQGELTWEHAHEAAVKSAGALAAFEDAGEFPAVVGSLVSDRALWLPGGWWRGPWIGAYQDPSASDFQEPAGGWRWVDGSAVSPAFFTDYGFGNPNDFPCCEDRLQLGEEPFAPKVNDVPSTLTSISFLIEWSADCNNDGIVDKGQILLGQLADVNGNGVPDTCDAPSCQDADIVEDAQVNGADLGLLLSQWGDASATTSGDLNHDGSVNGADLSILLSFWGPCP